MAKLTQDKELAKRRLENMEKQSQIDQQMADARQDWWEAQAEVLGEGGSQENFALRTNEFLDVLNQQETAYNSEVRDIQDALSQLDVDVKQSDLNKLAAGELSPEDFDVSEADQGWWDVRGREAEAQATALVSQLQDAVQNRESTRSQIENLQNVQAARLGGQARQTEGGGTGEGAQEEQGRGTRETPVVFGGRVRPPWSEVVFDHQPSVAPGVLPPATVVLREYLKGDPESR
jgi:hypothetical protein